MLRCHRICVALMLMSGLASADEIFVDNLIGRDSDDGHVSVARQGKAGPVRTLARATQLAHSGDVIILANHGVPYYESLSLTGRRHSGSQFRPFVIAGNGSTISGLRLVPREGWRREGRDLWRLTLTRKGFYQLLRNEQPLPEYRPEEGVDRLKSIPAGHWVSWHGSLYFRQDGDELPENQEFGYSADQTGISLHQVSYVQIVDVRLQHFRFDGLHAQGICDNIQLENVTSIENGRAGIASSGGSKIEMFGGTAARNGRHQILVLDRSTVATHDSQVE